MKKTIKYLLVTILFTLVIANPVRASINAPTRTNDKYVEDYAGVLSQETEDYINQLNYDLVSNYSGCVVVVTVNYYQGTEIWEYAQAIFNQWKIGNAETNDGILFLMSIGDDDYYVAPGRGIEEEINAGFIKDIFGDGRTEGTEYYFKDKDYDNSARFTAKALSTALINLYNKAHPGGNGGGGGSSQPSALSRILWLLLIIIILLLIVRIIVRTFNPTPANRRRYTLNHSSSYYRPRPSYYRPRPTYYYRPSGSGSYHSGSSYSSSHSSHSSSYSSHSSSSSSHSSSRPSMPSGGSSRGSGTGRHG